MKNVDEFIEKIKFKKVIAIYIVCSIIVGIFSVSFLGYKFKEKLIFAINYNNVSEKFEHKNMETDSITTDLINFANKSADIVDILIISNDNKVLFSAKNSQFNQNDFNLERDNNEKSSYLKLANDSSINFRLVKSDELMLRAVLIGNDKEIEHDHNNEVFFKGNFNSQKLFLLSYSANKSSGDKIYFISDIHPVQNGEIYIKAICAIATLFFMIYWVLLALYIYQNAKKSKLNPALWGIIVLCTNLAGVFIYLIYKQNNKSCFKCGAVQNKNNIYCVYCGTKISNTCDKCNKGVNEEDRFCKYCGNKLIDEEKND